MKTFAWEAGRFHKPRPVLPIGEDGVSHLPMPRRFRYRWFWGASPELAVCARVDEETDRLLLARAEPDVARSVILAE
jgi:hypothetical protein